MFHEGDLQSGISRAIQEQKLVACFVREDDNEVCSEWENSYLTSVKEETSSKVLEKLEGGITQDEFRDRLNRVLGVETHQSSQTDRHPDQSEGKISDPNTEAATLSQSDQNERPHAQQDAQNVSELFPGRAERHEAENQRRQAVEKAERAARAKARRKEVEEAQAAAVAATKDPNKSRAAGEVAEKERARQTWLLQQKQRKEEARQERKRILDQIENDKNERKARAQQEKNKTQNESPLSSPMPNPPRAGAATDGTCSLQIRLFDGSSIRKRFEATETLAEGVRTWIAEAAPANGGADSPYSFRLLLAPRPSRTVGVSEEYQTLQELGLVPSSTLVLVPAQGYTSAYGDDGGARAYVGSAVGAAYGLVGGAFRMLSSALSYVPGLGGAATHGESTAEASGIHGKTSGSSSQLPSQQSANSGSAKVKVKTLADQRAEAGDKDRQAEFYNGNSSAFEGRKDDDGDDV